MQVRSPGQEDPLEEGMATNYSTLAWRIPWTEETGRLQSMSSKESDTTNVTQHFTGQRRNHRTPGFDPRVWKIQ